MEALICTQNWLRSKGKSIDLQASMEEIEQYDNIDAELFEGGLSSISLEDCTSS
ncbi:hypothetical protein GIB67_039007 [Kingdonia uniflora]|uniref:Uncharacterized protein n=1 Tax=Kingdonia uniflora TaxID=39325 RepID=A0A7J7P7H2_9MAGN|nr:hypothetical protein GIB67_039007 [Kingdonia uniflora]